MKAIKLFIPLLIVAFFKGDYDPLPVQIHSIFTLESVIPASGSISIKSAAGQERSVAYEVDNNLTGNKSLTTLSVAAGKSSPHSLLEFLTYDKGTTTVNGCGVGSSDIDSCSDATLSPITIYFRTALGWTVGTILYTDAARAIPLTGFNYATHGVTGRNWAIDSVTGELISNESACILP